MTSTINATRRGILAAGSALGALSATSTANAAKKRTVAVPATETVWLDGAAPIHTDGVTFGVPWPQGAVKANATFALGDLAVQSWPLATWPDGSLKWSGHAIAATEAPAKSYPLTPGKPAAAKAPLTVTETGDVFTITSGDIVWTVPKSGKALISGATRGGKAVMGTVTLGALAQDAASLEDKPSLTQTAYEGVTKTAVLEQKGPVRTVIKLDGVHSGNGREWLPFSVRLYFYAGAASVRIVHSFIFDGDPQRDFIRGLSVRAAVPMRDEMYNRHVRFSGQKDGVWGEAVRSLTGLRRDAGKIAKDNQIAGRAVNAADISPPVTKGLKWIPAWSDFTLSQTTADGYNIRKRTLEGHAWVPAAGDNRATGLAYVGGAGGGVALGMKDFWQRCPSRLDIRGAASDEASVTAWMWSPDAPAMDIRPFRPVWGMEAYAAQNEGLDITYEDYEPGWDQSYGIARTTEFTLWALDATPTRDRFAAMARNVSQSPFMTVSPERLHHAGVFGEWSLPDSSTPVKGAIEKKLTHLLDYYIAQIDLHRWYGFWDYGDVMHTYDADRHVWRYDIGGFAWDNSELSTDMMFWMAYLRSGRADVFRLAEAMTRHTGEVDVYHIGPYRGYGTRHGVQHFSDSSKQARVSQAAFRRYYYYLAADERCGDLMRTLAYSDDALTRVDVARKTGRVAPQDPEKMKVTPHCSFGTDWGSFTAAWLTEWERTGDTKWRDRIANGMKSIATFKNGWFTGGAPFDVKTGTFIDPGDKISLSHLNGVFGVFEIHMELLKLIDIPAYKAVWIDYCNYYNAPEAELTARLGRPPGPRNLRDAHSRFTAYAARELKDPKLAVRAWEEFLDGFRGRSSTDFATQTVKGPDVLHETVEDLSVSTNATAQWGLAAIENLAINGEIVETAGAKYLKG